MKSNKIFGALKPYVRRLNPLWCLLGGILVLYLGRVAALFVLARGFEQINLNAETYSVAPRWLRFLADNADALASMIGLLLGICALILIKAGACTLLWPKRKQLLWLPGGLLLGIGFIALLKAVDEIRFLPRGAHTGAVEYALWLCLTVFLALWLRGAFDARANSCLSYFTSMLLQSVAALYLLCSFDAVLTLNAPLFGFLSVKLYRRTGSVLPEIFFLYSFTLGHRLISAYPAPRGYYMSANCLNGGDAGLFASVFTTGILAFMIAILLIGERKEAAHGKTTPADR